LFRLDYRRVDTQPPLHVLLQRINGQDHLLYLCMRQITLIHKSLDGLEVLPVVLCLRLCHAKHVILLGGEGQKKYDW
ncbi:MAG: hypothetical protein ACK55I_02955, partial [bacterium]